MLEIIIFLIISYPLKLCKFESFPILYDIF